MADEKTWHKSAPSQIVLDSIFAALAAVWITIALSDGVHIHAKLKFLEIGCSLLSFLLFASSAEGTTTAYDENDVIKYVYFLLWYNIGVILIGCAIAALIFAEFEQHAINFVGQALWFASPRTIRISVEVLYPVLFIVLLWRWIADAHFLLCTSEEKFKEYVRELTDQQDPKVDRGWLMRLLFRRRL